METASTACIPSKWRLTPRVTSSGRGPAAGSPSAAGPRATTSVSTGTGLLHCCYRCGRREDAPALRDDPAGPEPEETEDEPTEPHPLDRRDQLGRSEGRQVPGRLLKAPRNEERAEHRSVVVATAADNHRR